MAVTSIRLCWQRASLQAGCKCMLFGALVCSGPCPTACQQCMGPESLGTANVIPSLPLPFALLLVTKHAEGILLLGRLVCMGI